MLHLLHIGGLLVVDVVLVADALGSGRMLACHKGMSNRTLIQAWQLVEDSATSIVQQENAQTTAEITVPQGILIVKEAEVANDTEKKG